jgi:membrane-associated phospholipid phosphatase
LLIAGLFAAVRLYGKFQGFLRIFTYASAASILAYGCNFLLKIAFGRPVPLTVLQMDGRPLFHFFQGDKHSSFPSGHMALMTAFACILWQSYPGIRPFLPLALCLAAAAIVLGNWHYVSDIVAGAAVGSGAGLATAKFKARRD